MVLESLAQGLVVLMLLVVILLAQLKEKIIKYISMSVQRVAKVTCPFLTCTGQDTHSIYSYISQGSLSIGPHNHELNTYSVI